MVEENRFKYLLKFLMNVVSADQCVLLGFGNCNEFTHTKIISSVNFRLGEQFHETQSDGELVLDEYMLNHIHSHNRNKFETTPREIFCFGNDEFTKIRYISLPLEHMGSAVSIIYFFGPNISLKPYMGDLLKPMLKVLGMTIQRSIS